MSKDFDNSDFDAAIFQSQNDLNINNVLQSAIRVLSEIFNLDNCYIFKYDENRLPKLIYTENISSDNNNNLSEMDLNTEYDFNYWTELFTNLHKQENKNELYIKNTEEYVKNNNLKSTKIEKFFKDINLGSGLWLTIFENNLPEYLLLFSFKEIIPGCEFDEKFINLLTKNIKLNILSEKMESKIKALNEVYKLFNSLSQIVKKSLDTNVIKTEIINEIVKVYNPDRCFFRVYDYDRKILFSPDNEYLVDRNVESITYYVYRREANEYSIENYTEKGVFIVQDVELFIKENEDSKFLHIQKTIQVFKEQKLKSFYGFALYDENKIFSVFEIQYTKEKVALDEESIDLLNKIIRQSTVALKEVEFFEFQKYTAKKEKLLREVTEQSILIKNEQEFFDYLLKKISETFDLDGAIFIEVPQVENQKPKITYEYQRNKNYPSLLGAELPIECIRTYSYMIETFFPVVVNNTHNFYADEKGRQCFYDQFDIDAFMTTPVITETYPHVAMGAVVLFNHSPRIWLKNEIDLMRAIDDITMSTIDRIKKFDEIENLRHSFIQTMSHDMQVPLIAASNIVEFILNRPADTQLSKITSILEELKLSVDNQQKLLVKYIEIYQYESGVRLLKFDSVDISSVIKSTSDGLADLLKSKVINLEIDIQDNLTPVYADEEEIQKVIHIFLNNAIDYSPKNSKIVIKAREYKDIISVCVCDNGPGLPDTLREKIFDRFKMIEMLQRRIGGGLSLYLCKLIVETHHGKIWYNANEGKGSIFCFSLPKFTLETQE